jgi:FixJ family two-component response regulator
MMNRSRPRILVVDDEEAILETMMFTFEDDYEVFTSTDARRALDVLDQHAPIAVVLTDQRMPNMSGVEFVTEVCKRHPSTVRMILTGFSDIDAIIDAINDGHVYAYITKPWEPDQLKQLMKQAVEHYDLTVENERLVASLQHANAFLEAVMDHLDTGAIAVDSAGVIQAVNRPIREYLGLRGDLHGLDLEEMCESHGLAAVSAATERITCDEGVTYEDVELPMGGQKHRFRIACQRFTDVSGDAFGRVILVREISHEPLRSRYDDLVNRIVGVDGDLRDELEQAREQLRGLGEEVENSRIDSPGMGQLAERLSRTLTAVENWLDVDDAIAREDFPDAQLLLDRMRVATTRWPLVNRLPARVRELARHVEQYYESGENPKQRIL